MRRCLLPALLVAPMLLLLAFRPSPAGGDKALPWTLMLPDEVYKALTERSVKTIEDTAKAGGDGAAAGVEAEAAILAGYTFSTKNPGAGKPRVAASFASAAAAKNDIKGLAAFRKMIDDPPKAPIVKQWLGSKESFVAMMEVYRNKAKGGEGIHADLQYQPKLKNQNGIEALLDALGKKKLSAENLDKVAVELPRLSYRMAVTANLTQNAAPAKGKERWVALSVKMRDASVSLAESAQKKNAAGILKAAEALQNSCTECHREFRSK